jgi:hypothetical protein|tara:strand:- start:210 stop:467 length:258 start_codon:yes stop_codon:yes gene_type:complete
MSLIIKWPEEEENNLDLSEDTSNLKEYLVEYVGTKLKPEDDKVTVEMVINVLADEFPEVALSLAEENFIRGYEQGLEDLKAFEEK